MTPKIDRSSQATSDHRSAKSGLGSYSKSITSAGLSYVGFGVELAAGIGIQAVAIRSLGLSAVGIIVIGQVILLFSQTLVEFGINSFAARSIALMPNHNVVIDTSLFRLRLLMCIPAICGAALAMHFFLPERQWISILCLTSANLLFSALTPTWVFIGRSWYHIFSAYSSISKFISLIYIIVALHLFTRVEVWYSVFPFSAAILLILSFGHLMARRAAHSLRFSNISSIRQNLHSGTSYFISNLLYNGSKNAYMLVLSRFIAPAEFSAIAAADRVLSVITNLRFPVFNALFALHARSYSDQPINGRKANNRSTKAIGALVVFGSTLGGGLVYTLSDSICKLFVGPANYLTIAYLFRYYTPLIPLTFTSSYLLSVVLPAMDRSRELPAINVLNLIGAALLTTCGYRIAGITGVPIGLAATEILVIVSVCLLLRNYPT